MEKEFLAADELQSWVLNPERAYSQGGKNEGELEHYQSGVHPAVNC